VKALVLAGGEGTGLRPFSYSMPKQLIPVANRPVLEYILENVTYLGVREIGVIVGEWAPEIARVLGDGSRFGASLTYLPQDRLGAGEHVQVPGAGTSPPPGMMPTAPTPSALVSRQLARL